MRKLTIYLNVVFIFICISCNKTSSNDDQTGSRGKNVVNEMTVFKGNHENKLFLKSKNGIISEIESLSSNGRSSIMSFCFFNDRIELIIEGEFGSVKKICKLNSLGSIESSYMDILNEKENEYIYSSDNKLIEIRTFGGTDFDFGKVIKKECLQWSKDNIEKIRVFDANANEVSNIEIYYKNENFPNTENTDIFSWIFLDDILHAFKLTGVSCKNLPEKAIIKKGDVIQELLFTYNLNNKELISEVLVNGITKLQFQYN